MKEKFKALISDLDGTLVHTDLDYIVGVVQGTVKKVKNIEWDREKAIKFWFNYERDKMLKEEGILYDTFWKAFNLIDNHEERLKNTEPYYDIGFLGRLKNEDVKLGIITACYSKVAEKEIDMVGRYYIDDYVIANNLDKIAKPKPHPESMYRIMKSLDVSPSEVVLIGDDEGDMLLGRNAGVYIVHIDRKENPITPKTKPDRKVTSLTGLLDLFY